MWRPSRSRLNGLRLCYATGAEATRLFDLVHRSQGKGKETEGPEGGVDGDRDACVTPQLDYSREDEEDRKRRQDEIQTHRQMPGCPKEAVNEPGPLPVEQFLSRLDVPSPEELLAEDVEEEESGPYSEDPPVLSWPAACLRRRTVWRPCRTAASGSWR